jgi:DNA-binding NarL/FixJ family response regulator
VLALDLTGLEPAATRLATLVTLAATLSEIGWREPAGDLRAMLEPCAGQVVTVFNGVICLGDTDLALGRLAVLDGDPGRAEAHLRRSIVQHDRMGAVLLAGQGRAVLGRLLQRRSADPAAGGSGEAGAQLLAQARAAFRSRGATGLERLAAADEPAIRARAAAPAVGGLSAREVEVLELLADGLTNKQIAARLHLSAATVQRHTINLYRKIGVGGRSEAAAFAVHHGLHRTG